MDENLFKALYIGAAVFVGVATITAVLTYYSTAKAMVQSVGTGMDFDASYSDYVEQIILKSDSNLITGVDVMNLINYFYKDPLTEIRLVSAVNLQNPATKIPPTDNINNTENKYNEYYNLIVPMQKFEVTREHTGGILKLTLSGK